MSCLRFGRAVTVVIALVAAAGMPVEVAHADPIASCSTTVGTIVAVDFAHWGGPIVRGCGVNDSSGFTLLHAGGFTTAGDSHDGPAFICRLGNRAFDGGTQYPTPEQDPCIVTPPASAYWSYWLAPKGQNTWSHSQLGAMSEKPKPGEVGLWTFGATNSAGTTGSGVPTISPDTLRAKNTEPTGGAASSGSPTHRASPKASPHETAPGHTASAPSSGGSAHSPGASESGNGGSPSGTVSAGASPHRSPTSHKPTATPSAAAAGPATGQGAGEQAASDPKVVNAQPAAAGPTSAGSAVPLLIVLALVIILGGAAGWTVWRRRQQEQ